MPRHKLPPGPGRPKGSVNRLTTDTKEMLELAAAGLGGLTALIAFGKERPDIFWPMWSKLLPRNVDVTTAGKPLNPTERAARLTALVAALSDADG